MKRKEPKVLLREARKLLSKIRNASGTSATIAARAMKSADLTVKTTEAPHG